jgi:hypothetical protein
MRSGADPSLHWPLRCSAIAAVVLFGAMAMHAAPLDPSIPRLQLTFTETAFQRVLAQWQASGIERFQRHFALDFPLLVSYGLFGHLLARRCASLGRRRGGSAGRLAGWALLAAACLDAAENLLHLAIVYAPDGVSAATYAVAGTIAASKWLLIVVFAAGIAWAGSDVWRRPP